VSIKLKSIITMGSAKPSKKQRGKTKKALKAKVELTPKATLVPAQTQRTTGLGVSLKPAKSVNHVKFGDDGEATPVTVVGKKRGRALGGTATNAKKTKGTDDAAAEVDASSGGKSDRSPEMVQAAKYYLEQWKKRDQPLADGDEPWKFKVCSPYCAYRWLWLQVTKEIPCVCVENQAAVDSPVDV
jgi:hypothetical protein